MRLVYRNNWESDEYYVGGQEISDLKEIIHDGISYPVTKQRVSIPYQDMGHTYYAISNHYFIEVEVLGVLHKFDLNQIVNVTEVQASKYTLRNLL